MGAMAIRPQRPVFESYCHSRHAQAIGSVREEYEKLEGLTEDTVVWRILPTAADPFTVFFNGNNAWLVILLGFTGGIEFHPIRVLQQFGLRQDAFIESHMLERFRSYPLNSSVMTEELARLMRGGIRSTDIATVPGSDCTAGYIAEVQATWPICEVPPSGPLFSDAGSSKRARSSLDG